MSIGPHSSGRSGGNIAWLGSRHAVAQAHPVTLSAELFEDAEGVENGFVPSGYPLTKVDDLYGPYDGDTLDAFLVHGRSVDLGDAVGPGLWHGRIKTAHLPVEIVEPANAHQFSFVGDVTERDDQNGDG